MFLFTSRTRNYKTINNVISEVFIALFSLNFKAYSYCLLTENIIKSISKHSTEWIKLEEITASVRCMNIEIPFDSADKPQIVLDVLKVDIPQQRDPVFESSSKPEFNIQGKTLHVSYAVDSVKELRSAASSFYDQVLLITNIIKEYSD